MDELSGLLFIGDPHLASRVPGFRKDDYPRAVLGKLRWIMDYARQNRLRPVILGDLFDFPRDNANWLLVELLTLFGGEVLAVHGNHDCKENTLGENDTFSVLVAAGCVRLIDAVPWRGVINGRTVVVGGTNWGQRIPRSFERIDLPEPASVFWVCHHDVRFPGYEEQARFGCFEIPGVDAVINGHIHRNLPGVLAGGTTWLNPGNIARVTRSDITRAHVPGVLRVDISAEGWTHQRIEIPHLGFDEVFHPAVEENAATPAGSVFIRELAALESIRTASGAGLRAFLDANLAQFEPGVAGQIKSLAEEVLSHDQ